jgi:hypothetical protein
MTSVRPRRAAPPTHRHDAHVPSALSDRALRAAVAVAEDHGLRFSRPVVLRDLSSLLVHLAPADVVARVSTGVGRIAARLDWLRARDAV